MNLFNEIFELHARPIVEKLSDMDSDNAEIFVRDAMREVWNAALEAVVELAEQKKDFKPFKWK